ncbi:12802_t:CDS:2 [Funneliformis geosporum]|uniref:Vacuolar calcium ion transporter n=1 Tax=Funneliformis geosporum TaxID=1117311 RepID=A0A9W4SNC3_9GLOM|nr:12802_t:CDS:2 [Funneliformis geosporum]CAI2175706.1 3001_t:CDS:2 [Funneliformis geosporum]
MTSPSSERQPLSNNNSDYGSTSEGLHKPVTLVSFDNDNAGRSSSPVLYPPPPTIYNSLKIILTSSYINWLLIFLPLGFLANALNWSDTWIFTLNFFAIIPLAKLLAFATEDVSLRIGQTLGGLLNATFGNAVELIVSIIALKEGEVRVVQASMLGSIISNLLLVLGMCFVAGGIHHKEQSFNQTAAQTSSSLMTLACIGLIIPAAFNFAVGRSGTVVDLKHEILDLSHGTAIVLLIIYVLYLFFQLGTHKHLYDRVRHNDEEQPEEPPQEPEEEEIPQLTLGVSLFFLAAITLLVACSADYLVGSIEGIVESSGLSKTFVGLILLPIVGNAAEHVTAISVAMKNKMDLAINVAAGSSMQIALFITPFLVVLGWIIGVQMTLFFKTFETVVLFISVLITNYLIQDGKSNWLEGAMLLATYTIIALAFYLYPDIDDSNEVNTDLLWN